MHSPMDMHGGGDQGGTCGDGRFMGVPLIPAPMAFMALLFGVMIGVMIGHRKAAMRGMGGMGMGAGMGGGWHGMGGMGMGHGMGMGKDMGRCGGGGEWDRWAIKKRMMAGGMSPHHHHGDGAPACNCKSDEMSAASEPMTGPSSPEA